MAKKFCRLLPGFSEDVALDCGKHHHLNLREVHEQEAAGEIAFFDLHPVSKRARYIVKIHTPSPTAIPFRLMPLAAGANFPDASYEERRARRRVDAYDRIQQHEHPDYRWVVLHDITYDSDDVWLPPVSAKGRRPVRVALLPRTAEAVSAASSFYIKRYRPGRGTVAAWLGAMSEMRDALRELDRAWPQIVAQFSAGRWTDTLNEMRPGKLPSELLRRVLQAYLH